jgi:hypothetical protein
MKFTFSAIIAIIVLRSSRLAAGIIGPGDIVSPQFDNVGTVIVIHPATQQRETLSLSPNVGTGPALIRPISVARLPDGNFLVADTEIHQALTKVNAVTGNRTDLASAIIGSGAWDSPNTVLLTANGDVILVCEGFVARVDLTNGNRTLISGDGVGSGPSFAFDGFGGAALDKLGHVVVGVYGQSALYDVDLVSGTRSILSGLGHGSGPELSHVMDVVTLPNGYIIAEGRHYESDLNELFDVDPVTGNRTLISSGSFQDFEYERLALGANGMLLGSAPSLRAIFSIDPTTGARSLISGDGSGSGPVLFWGDMVQVPVPEPASAGMVMAGATILLALHCLRGRRVARARSQR